MKKILITVKPWEIRVAIISNGLLQNIYFDSKSTFSLERSFFKGKVAKILPGVQTAFVDIGQEKAGFLHISEIDRDLALKKFNLEDDDQDLEEVAVKNSTKNTPTKEINISKILEQGASLLVQVSKEPINEKGAKLTTCFSIPGRFVVLMPNIPKIGISKKISDFNERRRLKDIIVSQLPEEAGCIIRTTCEGKAEHEIVQDLKYLLDIWKDINLKFKNSENEVCLFKDIALYLQIIREHLDGDVEQIICDDKEIYNEVYSFVKNIASDLKSKVFFYKEKISLFDNYKIEEQIQQALQNKVELSSGGSIIIDSTEAMTVIDVNTGKYVGATKLEETLLKTNLEAAEEIVRQLKLRNIGGLIVIDFIDMSQYQNRQKLFHFFEQQLKTRDKFQSVVLKISEFSLAQMTRKRSGKTLMQQLMKPCPYCCGSGVVKSLPSKTYEIFRHLESFLSSKDLKNAKEVTIFTHSSISEYIVDNEYDALLELETLYRVKIGIQGESTFHKLYHFELITY